MHRGPLTLKPPPERAVASRLPHSNSEGFARILDEQLADFQFTKSFSSQRGNELCKQRVVRPEVAAARFTDVIPTRVLRKEHAIQETASFHVFDQLNVAGDVLRTDAVEFSPRSALRGADVRVRIGFVLRVNPNEGTACDSFFAKRRQLVERGGAVAGVCRNG